MKRFTICNEYEYGKVSQYKIKGMINSSEFLKYPLIMISENLDGGYYLYRTDINAEFGGDTFHDELEDVDDQIEYEFNYKDLKWNDLNTELHGSDLISFVVNQYVTRRKVIRFFFDPGSGICFWSVNMYTSDLLGYPINLEQLPLTSKSKNLLIKLMEKFDTCLDWQNPGAGVVWNKEDEIEFHKEALVALDTIREELGEEYIVVEDL